MWSFRMLGAVYPLLSPTCLFGCFPTVIAVKVKEEELEAEIPLQEPGVPETSLEEPNQEPAE